MLTGWSKGCECCIFARITEEERLCNACMDLPPEYRKVIRMIKEQFNPEWLSRNIEMFQKMFFDANVVAALKRGSHIATNDA